MARERKFVQCLSTAFFFFLLCIILFWFSQIIKMKTITTVCRVWRDIYNRVFVSKDLEFCKSVSYLVTFNSYSIPPCSNPLSPVTDHVILRQLGSWDAWQQDLGWHLPKPSYRLDKCYLLKWLEPKISDQACGGYKSKVWGTSFDDFRRGKEIFREVH